MAQVLIHKCDFAGCGKEGKKRGVLKEWVDPKGNLMFASPLVHNSPGCSNPNGILWSWDLCDEHHQFIVHLFKQRVWPGDKPKWVENR